VWTEEGSQGVELAAALGEAKLTFVLGPGNQAPSVAGDILHKVFLEGNVVICKFNPTNEYLGPALEDCFAPLIRRGFLRLCYGGPEVSKALVHHDKVLHRTK
jgi:hypothetical protein